MENNLETNREVVFTVANNRGLIAIVRKDPVSKKNLIYSCKEMNSEEITKLISPAFIWPIEK